MGWTLKIKKTKKEETKYRFWSENSNSWITDWLVREDVIKFLFWHKFDKFLSDFVQEAMCFPGEWVEKDSMKYIAGDEALREKYFRLSLDRHKQKPDILIEKFKEITKDLGISLHIQNEKGEGLKN